MNTVKLRVGDTVMVRSGRDKGKTGKVTAVHPKDNKVTVEGVNVVKKHRKPNQQNNTGAVVEITKPIWVSKVGIVHPSKKDQTTRIGYKVDDKGNKTRIFKANGKEIK
ncbi:TPA: 50S ribosomal protein L24 [Candidatus Saccharibacteria bacterium]|nr:50S ribosomal protein L24 [Candidatus Saccharibacteria bacterium]HIO87389.1 50S ribosomal protein L24 [Candidatus Saccharibacteria bacterium]